MASTADNEKPDLNSRDSTTTSMQAICNDDTTTTLDFDESLASPGSPVDRSSDEEAQEYIPEDSEVSSSIDIDTSATEEILEEEDKVEEIPVVLTTKKRNAKVMKAETAPKRSTNRELKETKRFEADLPPKKKKQAKKAIAVQQKVVSGNGEKLGKIPFIKEKLATTSPNDLTYVHHVCFGRKGTGNEALKNLRAFSGFPFDEDSAEFAKRKAVISRSLEVKNLKVVCSVLGVAQGKKKEETIRNILEFCLNPEDDGQDPNSKKRSPTTTKAKTKLAANAKKVSKNDESAYEKNSEVEVVDDEPPKKKSRKAAGKSKYNADSEQEADGDVSEQESDEDDQKKKRKKKRVSKKSVSKNTKEGKKFTENEAMAKKSKESESDSEQSEIDVEKEDSGLEDSDVHPSLDINQVTPAEMKKIVKQVIKKADLHTYSMNDIMESVKIMFNIDVAVKLDSKVKSQIRKFVGEYLN